MIAFWTMVFSIASTSAIVGSVILGLMIGALYGYTLEPARPPRYPYAFWGWGIAFIVVIGVISYLDPVNPIAPASQVGRAILWTFMCASIPLGRYARQIATLKRLRKKYDRVRFRPETVIEEQDRKVGDQRRELQAQEAEEEAASRPRG